MGNTNAIQTRTTPKDFFLQLGSVVGLYISVISLLTLLFQIINVVIPDVVERAYYYDPYSGALRFAIASLIVVFPIFLLISWLLEREYVKNPAKHELSVKRWLTYITLFVAGVAIVIDVIVLLNVFLNGELALRFFLKVLAVLVVVGVVFGYYIYDLRRTVGEKRNIQKIFFWGSVVVVLASIIGGFAIIGSPATQRDLRLDRERVQDLDMIQYQILSYWQKTDELPENLSALNDPLFGFIVPEDPETGESYEYHALSNLSFELCAIFAKDGSEVESTPEFSRAFPGLDGNWQHGAGRKCFERVIDPERHSLPESANVKPRAF